MNLSFKRAGSEDIELVITLQNQAFEQDYIRYGSCPSYRRPFVKMEAIIRQEHDFIIYLDETPIGNVIVKLRPEQDECHINSIGIIPGYQGKGIGRATMDFVHSYFNYCSFFTLDTPADKQENIRFYKKCGYHIVGILDAAGVACVLFERTQRRG